MRVLIINHFPLQGSGSGIYSLNIAAKLIEHGHQAMVIDIDNCHDTNKYPFPWRTIICDKTKNKEYDLDFNFPCFTTHPRSVNTYYSISKEQIKQYVDVFMKVSGEVVNEFKPDVIHAQHLWIAPEIAKRLNYPCVVTAHGTDLLGFDRDERYRELALSGAKHANSIIAISKQVRDDTERLYGVPSEKIHINPNGVATEIFKIKDVNKDELLTRMKMPKKEEFDKLVTFVGKFTPEKGIDVMLKAWRQVTDKLGPRVLLSIAGDGTIRPDMEKLVTDLKLPNVYFLGHQSQDTVASLHNIAELALVPSLKEAFGLVVLEGMACGIPVVATRAGGIPDFLDDRSGALVPPSDVCALADAIIKELENNSKKTKGVFAAEYSKKYYSWDANIEKVFSLYRSAIDSHKK